jgi:hypothetical protein
MVPSAKFVCDKIWWVADATDQPIPLIKFAPVLGKVHIGKFPTRPLFGARRQKERSLDRAHLIKKNVKGMSAIATNLIARMGKEISRCLLTPTSNQLLAFCVWHEDA